MSNAPIASSPAQSPAPLQYVSQAGEEMLAPIAANAHLLQQAGEYYAGTRLLRTSGLWDLFWGFSALLLTVALVLAPIPIGSLRLPLILVAGALAAVMIAAGCWLVFAPSPAAMIVDGVCLIVIALTNIGLVVYDLLKPPTPPP